MRNREQERAKHAIKWAGKIRTGTEGSLATAKKVSAMIVENGFIGAMAFACEKKKDGTYKNDGHASVFEAIVDYLRGQGLAYGIPAKDNEGFLDGLCAKDAGVLRTVTMEAIAYMNYLRRFAKPGSGENSGRD